MGRTVILNEEVNTASDIAGASRNAWDKTPFAEKTMRDLPRQDDPQPLWMAAAIFAMTWTSETQASPDQARHLADAEHAMAARNFDSDGTVGDGELPSRGSKSVQVAQATTSNTGAPQRSPGQEHHGAETLSCELTIAGRDIELLQHLGQEHDRVERMSRISRRRDAMSKPRPR